MIRKFPAHTAVACFLLMFSCMPLAHAADAGLGFVFEADLEFGGDDLATLNFTDGSTQDVNGWWIGGGITHHSSIKFDADGFGPNINFDDATGPTFEAGWRWIALSYTKLDYKDEFGGKWDASSVGLKLTSKF